MAVRIITDSACDLSQEYASSRGITVIPLKVRFGDEEFLDGVTITPDAFYERLEKKDVVPKTSQITPYTYEQIFRKEAEQGHNVLYLCLSSGLSSTYASSLNAAQSVMEDFPDVKIESVDTLGATGGVGLLLMQAIKGRDEGKTISENAAYLRQIAPDIGFWFMVEDLEYLKRGGRVSATAAFAGNVLNLKPVLKINDEGKLVTSGGRVLCVYGEGKTSDEAIDSAYEGVAKISFKDMHFRHDIGRTLG